jgi:hypothetical protein
MFYWTAQYAAKYAAREFWVEMVRGSKVVEIKSCKLYILYGTLYIVLDFRSAAVEMERMRNRKKDRDRELERQRGKWRGRERYGGRERGIGIGTVCVRERK